MSNIFDITGTKGEGKIMAYQVKLEIFEGPLDLLLFLTKKNDLNIYDISVSEITTKYLEYLRMMKLLNLEITGDFLVMAATLIQIKSKMLLPSSDEDEDELDDPRKKLIERLIEYKKFKEVSKVLERKEVSQRDIFYRESPVSLEGEYVLEVSLFDLLDSVKKVFSAVAQEEVKNIIDEEIRVEDKMQDILYRVEENDYVSFSEIFSKSAGRQEIVVILLALLELIKMKKVFARQASLFGNIRIYKANNYLKETKEEEVREIIEKEEQLVQSVVENKIDYGLSISGAESE
jgi:segregation and condensation protein A